jgi:hypothetical protein
MISLLLEKGANPNHTTKTHDRPLHFACSEEAVDLLLKAGADARVFNNSKSTPLQKLMALSLINDHNFIHLKKKDAGLTELSHKLKMLGLRFSLQGNWAEGYSNKFTFAEMAASWNEFIATQPKELQDKCKGLSDHFLEIAPFEYTHDFPALKRLQNQELLILPLRFKEGHHAMVLTVMGRFVIRGNRGFGIEKSGLTIFEMEHPEQALEGITKLLNVLEKSPSPTEILKNQKESNAKHSYQEIERKLKETYTREAVKYFNNTFLEDVGLKSLYHLNQKKQVAGNCSWMAAKMGLRASLIFIFLKETGNLQFALQQAKSIYKQWSLFDYERSLRSVREILQEPLLNANVADHLCDSLVSKCLKKAKISWIGSIFIDKLNSFFS